MKINSKTGLKVFNYAFIEQQHPRIQLGKFLPKAWRGTAVDLLNVDEMPFFERLSTALHPAVVSADAIRAFEQFCYRQARSALIKNPTQSIQKEHLIRLFLYDGEQRLSERSKKRVLAPGLTQISAASEVVSK